jgi:Protein kinase domain
MGQSAAAARDDHHLVLGRYRVVRALGSGGSGTVWLARDVIDDRDVALKVVPKEGKAGERAEREALAVARLRSPRIARAYAVERDDGHVYVAYEYVAGRTMRESIRAGQLSDGAAIEAAAQLLEALSHAHRRRIVHRDVKPSNILVEDGEEVSVRLLDFGLAQLEEEDTLTAAGDVPGTLAYISPERLAGQNATGAADVWAVGVILWEALAGYQPFFSTSPVETARLIGAGAPPLAKVRPDLPRSLTAAVDRSLALDPRRRPAPERLAVELRESVREAAARRERRSALSRRVLLERLLSAALAAGFAALAMTLLPFFPPGPAAALAFLVALATLAQPRGGLALALVIPALPLGNISLGLALAYLPVAAIWFLVSWRDARHGLLCFCGPLLSFAGALPLAPLACAAARGPLRRALHGAAAVLLAASVAGLRGAPFPLTGEQPPLGLGVAGSESARAVASGLWHALAAEPAILVSAVVVGIAAALLPVAAGRGLWGVVAFAAMYMAALAVTPVALGVGPVESLSVVLSAWAIAAVLALRTLLGAEAPRAPALQ